MRPLLPPLCSLLLLAAGPADDEVDGRLGEYRATHGSLHGARAAAFGSNGRLYVAETGAHRVSVRDARGAEAGGWGGRGDDAGRMRAPGGIAVGEDGTVVVADTGNHRLQVFTGSGTWVASWGSRGTGEGHFQRPGALVVADERVYVADTGNDRVVVLDRSGGHLDTWGADALSRPSGLALGGDGRLYVADTGHHRVVVFDGDGTLLGGFGDRGSFPGLLAEPHGLAWGADRLYVADRENHRIQVFDVSPVPGRAVHESPVLYQWGLHALRPRDGEGRLHYPDDVVLAPGGDHVVVCEGIQDRLQTFGPAEREATAYAADPSVRSGIAPHYGPPVAVAGDLMLLTEPESQSVMVFDLREETPVLVHRLGGWGEGAGRFRRLTDVAFAYGGLVLASDGDARRLQTFRLDRDPLAATRFDPTMGHLVQAVDLLALLDGFDDAGRAGGPRIEPDAIAGDADGRLYIADGAAGLVRVLDARWRPLRVLGAELLRRPVDLALGADGRTLLVADADLRQVLAFAPDGRPAARWGDDVLEEPAGLAVAADGAVFVTDVATHQVHRFDARGALAASWGGEGLASGRFFKPRGIACVGDDRLVVLDHGNHRGQLFQRDGTFVRAFGARLYVEAATAEPPVDPTAGEENRPEAQR